MYLHDLIGIDSCHMKLLLPLPTAERRGVGSSAT